MLRMIRIIYACWGLGLVFLLTFSLVMMFLYGEEGWRDFSGGVVGYGVNGLLLIFLGDMFQAWLHLKRK